MSHQCYYCEHIFNSKDKLYEHLKVHSVTKKKQEKKNKRKNEEKLEKRSLIEAGLSPLSEDKILEQFKETKSSEPSRISSRPRTEL